MTIMFTLLLVLSLQAEAPAKADSAATAAQDARFAAMIKGDAAASSQVAWQNTRVP